MNSSLFRNIRAKKITVIGFAYYFAHLFMPRPSSDIKNFIPLEKYQSAKKKSIKDIRREQCIGCGMCFSVCGSGAIAITKDSEGFIPELNEDKCTNCGLCYKSCPGINILEYTPLLGDIRRTIISRARDRNVQYNASSGGTCRSILAALLEKNIADRVIITRATDDPFRPETIITGSVDDLSSDGLNSVYSPTSPLASLKNLDKNLKYAFVGLPCHIAGIALNPAFKKSIELTIGIFCSHTPGFSFINAFLGELSREGGVKRVSYRGNGWPGKTRVYFNDNSHTDIPFPAIWHKYNYSRRYQQQRCASCTYYSAEYADLSIGDPWSLTGKSRDGLSLIFVRSQKGMEAVEAASERIAADDAAPEQLESILSFHKKSAAAKLRSKI